MKKQFKSISLFLVMLLLGVTVAPLTDTFAAQDRIVKIMHTNDMHGRMEPANNLYALARLKTFKDQENPLLMLDGGDAFQGLPISNTSKGAEMAKIMNAIGYDAMAVGNHEFDFGSAVALGKEDGFGKVLNFPMLSTNTVYKNDGSLLFDPSISFNMDNSDNSQTVIKDGYKIVIVGATTPETHTKTHPKNIEGIEWKEPIPAVTDELLKAKHADADFYVVVTHLGIDKETKTEWRSDTLAQSLADNPQLADKPIIIVDGHSHTPIEDGIFVGDNVILVQTGEHMNNVGLVSLNLDNFKESKAKLVSFQPTKEGSMDHLPAVDPTVKTLIDTANDAFKESVSRVILEDNKIHFDGLRDHVRTRETNLGNIITDAMVAYGKEGFTKPTHFAIINGGGIRTDIKVGPVTEGDLIAVLPFGNVMTQIEMTGTQITEMFEHSLRTATTGAVDVNGMPILSANGGFLHVSDTIRVHYDSTKDSGSRVLGIEVYDVVSDTYQPLEATKTYYVATNDFLAAGGDGFSMMGGPREEGPSLDKVFSDYLEFNPLIDWDLYKADKEPYRILAILEEDYVKQNLNYTELNKALEEASKIVEKDYTKDSYAKLQKAVDEGKAIVAESNASNQDEIDKATLEIQNALKVLVKVDENKPGPDIDDGDGGELPGTGVPMYSNTLLLGAAALGIGTTFVVYDRKRRR